MRKNTDQKKLRSWTLFTQCILTEIKREKTQDHHDNNTIKIEEEEGKKELKKEKKRKKRKLLLKRFN